MLDIKFVRENPDIVKENIKKKFQDSKLPLVDEVIDLDAKSRAAKQEADELRAQRNKLSKQIGALMGQGKKEEAEEVKAQVTRFGDRLAELEVQETELAEKIKKIFPVFLLNRIFLSTQIKVQIFSIHGCNTRGITWLFHTAFNFQ